MTQALPPTATDSAHVPAVEVRHLSRTFRGVEALRDVSIQIPVGSIFGLVGLNGAGKTTLIRHLIGALRCQQGTVRLLGEDPVTQHQSVLKKVGYLTEEDTLPKWMRLGELIDFSRAIYDSWDDSYAKRLCDTFGLSRKTKLRSLSKGQRARAGLLVAIAHRPELLILDEPSSGLDPIARSDILEAIIRTISEDGRTVLFSSHHLDEVDRVCDSIALMREGQILESQTTEQMENRYEEIVCRPEGWTHPPERSGVFGWRRNGEEWSAVIESGGDGRGTDPFPKDWMVIDRRNITLQRWFAARVGTEAPGSDSNSADEVTADV